MTGTIELTTSPSNLPRQDRLRRWAYLILAAFIVLFPLWASHLTWRELVQSTFSPRFALVMGPWFMLMGLLYFAKCRKILITAQYIECVNTLPSWLKFLHPEWRIERQDLATVLADLRRGSGTPAIWRILFVTKQGQRCSVPLLGWYRLGVTIEGQRANIQHGATRGDYTEQVEALAVVVAMKEAGLKVLVDAKPSKDTFSNTRVGWLVASGCFFALICTVAGLVSWRDLYAAHAPWALMCTIGGLAGILTWWALRRTDIPGDNKGAGILAATVLFGAATWALAPLVNGMTSGGYQEIQYHYEGSGVFVAEDPDAPTLDLSQHLVSFKSWRPGDPAVFHLRHGALGFWQYDRDLTIATIRAKSKKGRT